MKIKCNCGATYQPSPRLAGKKVRCKKCSAILVVPKQKSSGPTPTKTRSGTTTHRKRTEGRVGKREASYQRQREASMSFDDRVADRQRETMEAERIPNVVKYLLIGLACFAAAVGTYYGLNALEKGGVAPRIVWIFVVTKGKFWVPPLLILAGLYQLYVAYYYLTWKPQDEYY